MSKASINLLIGGPGTGKSTTLQALQKKGYPCFEEISRQVTLDAQKEGISQLFLEQPLLFSQKLLAGRIKQYQEAQALQATCFIDRGIPDITAYMDLFNEDYTQDFINANHDYTYSKVFHFPIWKEIYEQDNERYENFEQASKIDKNLLETYSKLGYSIIEVPKTSIEERVEFIIKHS